MFGKIALVGLLPLLLLPLSWLLGALGGDGLQWLVAVGALASAGWTLYTAAYFTRSVGVLSQVASDAARGDFSQKAYLEGNDELTRLAIVTNDLYGEIGRRLASLRERVERYETVLDSMTEGVIAADQRHRILLANRASQVMLDLPQDFAKKQVLEVVRNRQIDDAVQAGLGDGGQHKTEIETPQSKRRLSVNVARLPAQPPSEQPSGVVLVLHDVTQLRRLENLRQEFVANVSHELKTPLASISAYAETLRCGAINDPRHNLNFVTRIEEQAHRLHELILDILQLARIESGDSLFEIVDLPLQDFAQEVAADFRMVAQSKDVKLSLRNVDGVWVHADREALRTILSNLIDNAIKHTGAGGEVTIAAKRASPNVIVEVSDTGIGISEEDQPRVFERFYRVDKARSRDLGGTGLGLSIVKHLSIAMGGQAGVESELGKGSCFWVRLPMPESSQ